MHIITIADFDIATIAKYDTMKPKHDQEWNMTWIVTWIDRLNTSSPSLDNNWSPPKYNYKLKNLIIMFCSSRWNQLDVSLYCTSWSLSTFQINERNENHNFNVFNKKMHALFQKETENAIWKYSHSSFSTNQLDKLYFRFMRWLVVLFCIW